MSSFKIASIFILVCLVLTRSLPLNFGETRDKICGSTDDYFNSSDDEFQDVFNVLRSMLQVFAIKLDELKYHYIERFIHDEEICITTDGYLFPLLGGYNTSNESSIESRQLLINLYKELIVVHLYTEELLKEDETLLEKHHQELTYNTEGGMAGMICFIEPYIPLEARHEIATLDIALPTPANKADHHCRDFHLIDLIYNTTLLRMNEIAS